MKVWGHKSCKKLATIEYFSRNFVIIDRNSIGGCEWDDLWFSIIINQKHKVCYKNFPPLIPLKVNKLKINKTRSDILQGQAPFRGVEQLLIREKTKQKNRKIEK